MPAFARNRNTGNFQVSFRFWFLRSRRSSSLLFFLFSGAFLVDFVLVHQIVDLFAFTMLLNSSFASMFLCSRLCTARSCLITIDCLEFVLMWITSLDV